MFGKNLVDESFRNKSKKLLEPIIGKWRRHMEQEQSTRQSSKFLWLFVLLAFLIGTILGLSVFWWQKISFDQQLQSQRKQFKTELEKTRRTTQELEKKIAKLESQAINETESNQTSSTNSSKKTSSSTSSKPLNITSRSADPGTVAPEGDLTLQVELEGEADKVEMEITGEGFKKTYSLKKIFTSEGMEVWETTISAPSNPGLYRYFAHAYQGDKQVSMPGVSAWSFMVSEEAGS